MCISSLWTTDISMQDILRVYLCFHLHVSLNRGSVAYYFPYLTLFRCIKLSTSDLEVKASKHYESIKEATYIYGIEYEAAVVFSSATFLHLHTVV